MTISIRYVHANKFFDTTRCPYSGFTICYYREDNYVKFSYALCLKNDQYSKEIGRQRSAINLNAIPIDSFDDLTNFDDKLRCGTIEISYFKEAIGRFGLLSDQLIADLTMYDFKHAAISKILIDFVYGLAIVHKYPNSRL